MKTEGSMQLDSNSVFALLASFSVLMSTPNYETTRSRRTLHEDRLAWSPDSIVARGNLSQSHCPGPAVSQVSGLNTIQ